MWDYDRSSSNDFLGEVSNFCLEIWNSFKIHWKWFLLYVFMCLFICLLLEQVFNKPINFISQVAQTPNLNLALCQYICIDNSPIYFVLPLLSFSFLLSFRYWLTCQIPPSWTTFLAGCLWKNRVKALNTAEPTMLPKVHLGLGQVKDMATCQVLDRDMEWVTV